MKLSLIGVISVSAIAWLTRIRYELLPRRIDDDEVEAMLDPADRLGEGSELAILDVGECGRRRHPERDREMGRQFQRHRSLAPSARFST